MKSNLSSYLAYLNTGEFSDLYLEESQMLSLRWEEGRLESVNSSEDSGAGVRIINGLRTNFGHLSLAHPLTEKLNNDDKSRLESLLSNLGSGLSKQSRNGFQSYPYKNHPIKNPPQKQSLDMKINLLERAYKATQINSSIRQVNVNYGEKIKKVGYINSDGLSFMEDRIYLVFNVTVTAERKGDLQNAYESLGGVVGLELFEQNKVEDLARMVAERAILKLEAPQAPVGEMPVVIAASAGGTLIHEAVGHSLEADAVLEGTSPAFLGKVGKQVANEKLTVFDDPTVSSKRGSFFYDDEGVPSEASKLIDKGILRDYMFDRLSAKRANRNSNGHGRRESYAYRPIPRMSNTFIAPGPDDPNDILNSFKEGLLVTKMGGGQVNTANGDFVFDVEEGFRVKDGKKQLVRGATLLGNGPRVLLSIDRVGTDQGWGLGTCGKEGQGVPVSDALPTIRIKKLVVGGQ